MATTGNWITVSMGLPPEITEAITALSDLLEAVSTLLEILAAILEIIKVFLANIASPLEAIIQIILEIVNSLLEDFQQTGLYMYVDGPRGGAGLKYFGQNLEGGVAGWRSRMAYAFLSPGVSNRPQFGASASVVSFSLLVTSGDIGTVISQVGFLLSSFQQRSTPNLPPARNFQGRAVNSSFVKKYYNPVTGTFDEDQIAAEAESIKVDPAPFNSHFLGGGGQADPDTMELVLRYDAMTGEELIIDKVSGAILDVGGLPDSTLLTWKIDSGIIPVAFRIERTDLKGGTLATRDVVDTAGNEIATNELIRDNEGQPIRTVDELVTIEAEYGFNTPHTGAAYDQYAWLDEDNLEPGSVYYYRMIPIYGSGLEITAPQLDPNNDIIKTINALLQSILRATSGEGDPTDFVSVYIPASDADAGSLFIAQQRALESNNMPVFVSPDVAGEGWVRVGIGDLFKPVLMIVEELQNFIQMLLDSIGGIVDQIVAFIELLQTKIESINTFIEILQAIIALLQVFEAFTFSCLFVATTEGNSGVLSAINDDTLAGVPTAGDAEYTASVTILGGTVGAGAALNALRLLFGIS